MSRISKNFASEENSQEVNITLKLGFHCECSKLFMWFLKKKKNSSFSIHWNLEAAPGLL